MISSITIKLLTNGILVGYMVSFIFLNFITYLISSFYRIKLNQPAPKIGFVVSIVLSLLYIVALLLSSFTEINLIAVNSTLLILSGIISGWSSISLLYTMKKVRK